MNPVSITNVGFYSANITFSPTDSNRAPFLKLLIDNSLGWGQEGWGGHMSVSLSFDTWIWRFCETNQSRFIMVGDRSYKRESFVVIGRSRGIDEAGCRLCAISEWERRD